jgi:hypothetical protein
LMTCVFATECVGEKATSWLITQRSRIRILSSLPAETRPEGFAPRGCHAACEHGLTCQLSALPHGAAARTTVCMFGSLKPPDRSSELRSFGLSEADHSGILSGSRPMQQRLVCVEAGQTFSIQRMEVLTPQVSSIHCRLTRGRSLVRSQSGPQERPRSAAVWWAGHRWAIEFIRQNPPRVDVPLDYLTVCRGTGTAPHSTCGHRRRQETVESGIGDGGGGVVNNWATKRGGTVARGARCGATARTGD